MSQLNAMYFSKCSAAPENEVVDHPTRVRHVGAWSRREEIRKATKGLRERSCEVPHGR